MRWLTSLALICICGFAGVWGWQAMEFAYVLTTADNRAKGLSLSTWIGVPGLTEQALETSLHRPASSALPPTLRKAQLTTLIAVYPMSAQAWLSLAGEDFILGRPAVDIDAAVTMSSVTGPNEGSVMLQRGLFELIRWQALSSHARRQAATDVVGALTGGVVDDAGIRLAKAILGQQSADARDKIAAALVDAGASLRQLALMGFQSDPG